MAVAVAVRRAVADDVDPLADAGAEDADARVALVREGLRRARVGRLVVELDPERAKDRAGGRVEGVLVDQGAAVAGLERLAAVGFVGFTGFVGFFVGFFLSGAREG